MNKTIFILIFLISNLCVGQNLVPNPSFEDTIFCPWAENQMPLDWMSFGASPDYLNGCSSALNVPNTPTGFHSANSGVGMIGVFNYVNSMSSGWPDYREFVGAQLINPLSIGQKYFMSFYISYARINPVNWNGIGSNRLGLRFSTTQYTEMSTPTLDNFAHLCVDSIFIDTAQWIKISGAFVADSSYNYIMLGNFFDEMNTDTLYFGGPPNWTSGSYYFIDDICVTTDSLYNLDWNGVARLDEIYTQPSVYPNPANKLINVESLCGIDELFIINNLAQTIFEMNVNGQKKIQLNLSDLCSGTYILKIRTNNDFSYQRLIINH